MSAIDLSALPIAGIEVSPIEFGGVLSPILGGPEQRIDRPGSRWSITFTTPSMRYEPAGRQWAARLRRAQQAGALIEIPQPDVMIGNPGAPVVATNIASGKLLALAGVTPGYVVGEGQWVSIISGGRRYADQVTASATADGAGAVTITLANLLRVPLLGGEVVEIASPKIEGWLQDLSWPIDTNRHVQFGFTIGEAA